MARPLAKQKKDGQPYVRPPAIEEQIDAAMQLTLPILLRRVDGRDQTSSEYPRSECLVHLIREARRRGDDSTMNGLLRVLLSRCERKLRGKLPDGSYPNAVEMREEVLSQFGELFAIDGTDEGRDQLDFFECRFNRALQALRIDVVRRERKHTEHTVQLPATNDEGAPVTADAAFARFREVISRPPTQESEVSRAELCAAIEALPTEERDAVALCHLMGYDVESDDPDKRTAATICGVTGRTIRNRLARASQKLARFEEKS